MQKSKPSVFDFGDVPDAKYYSTGSTGWLNTFCATYQRCTDGWAESADEIGFQGRSLNTLSGVVLSDVGTWGLDTISSVRTKRVPGAVNRPFNPCVHSKTERVNYPITGVVPSWSDSRKGTQYFYSRLPVLTAVVPEIRKHEFPDLQAAKIRAFAAMQPKFEGQVSCINYIAELPENITFVKLGLRAAKQLRSLIRSRKMHEGVKLFDPTKSLSELHLMYQFGIKPLVSDTAELIQQLKFRVEEKQLEFQSKGVDLQTRHYSEINDVVNTALPGLRVATRHRTTFTATLDYTYKYSLRPYHEAFKKYYGLEPTAEALWQGMPWSFVFDYFLKIGDAIAWSERDSNVDLNVVSYGESLKTQYETGYFLNASQIAWPIYVNRQEVEDGTQFVSGCRSKLYTRYAAVPSKGIVTPRVGVLSSSQKLNLAALARSLV